MTFDRVTFNLSMINDDGSVQQASMYHVEGIDRMLSIGELVMAICLDRACELESRIIQRMDASAKTTRMLESISLIEQAIVLSQEDKEESATNVVGNTTSELNDLLAARGYDTLDVDVVGDNWAAYLKNVVELDSTVSLDKTSFSYKELSTLTTDMSSKMDSLNSVGQEELLELQSLTNKRDEAYNLISNVLKSLNSTLMGNANNI